MMSKIKITLIKSLIGRMPKHIEIAKQLRLRKMNSVAIHQDNPAIRGLIRQIDYLLKVEECA
ncbi:50S ribosomal protein L30 [Legionella nagasakiensis]|uniref:50S ribosomal protein L30 n=1 Tax=Legionella nagasakiensis TaxID=535290 RepID=UPI0013EF660E|nr:50S ribosomal protein L30 [Legionella nagasakiensis]